MAEASGAGNSEVGGDDKAVSFYFEDGGAAWFCKLGYVQVSATQPEYALSNHWTTDKYAL